MKLPGEAGGNWSERQTKARTYGHGLQLHSAAVGRRLAHLLYFRGEFLIHSPSLIPATRPRSRARGSFIRPANYESSRRMSNRLNCEAPPQPKARAARESVSSCADCATATQPRAPVSQSYSRARARSYSRSYSRARLHLTEKRGTKFSPRTPPVLLYNARSTRDMPVYVYSQPFLQLSGY